MAVCQRSREFENVRSYDKREEEKTTMTTYKGIKVSSKLVNKDGDIRKSSKPVLDDIVERLERDNHTFVGEYKSANSIKIDFKCGHPPQAMYSRNYTHGGLKCLKCYPLIDVGDFTRKVHALKQYELWLIRFSFNSFYEAGEHDGYWNLPKYIPEGVSEIEIKAYKEGYASGQEMYIEFYEDDEVEDRPISLPQKAVSQKAVPQNTLSRSILKSILKPIIRKLIEWKLIGLS